jgi:putative ABC transport system permease protein
VIAGQVAHPRFNLLLIGAFALVALALGTVGIYGVVATWVARRTRELGVRIALGAGRGQILALVLSQGTRMLGAGIVAGLLLSAAASRVLSSLLYQVNALDPAIFAGVATLLLATGLASLALPALRATRVDPMESLRAE